MMPHMSLRSVPLAISFIPVSTILWYTTSHRGTPHRINFLFLTSLLLLLLRRRFESHSLFRSTTPYIHPRAPLSITADDPLHHARPSMANEPLRQESIEEDQGDTYTHDRAHYTIRYIHGTWEDERQKRESMEKIGNLV